MRRSPEGFRRDDRSVAPAANPHVRSSHDSGTSTHARRRTSSATTSTPSRPTARNRNVKADVDRVVALDDERKQLVQRDADDPAAAERGRQADPAGEGPGREAGADRRGQAAARAGRRARAAAQAGRGRPARRPADHPEHDPPRRPGRARRRPTTRSSARGASRGSSTSSRRTTSPCAEALDLVDFEAGAAVAGQKFYFLKNEAVLLELALVQYAMQTLVADGLHAGHHARPGPRRGARRHRLHAARPEPGDAQVYTVADTDLCLIATAEITLGGMHRDQIFDEAELPQQVRRPVALLPHRGRRRRAATPAGCTASTSSPRSRCSPSARPSRARRSTRRSWRIEEEIFQGLGLPYHVIDTCTGDLGGPAYRKYDLEAWMPGRGQGGAGRRCCGAAHGPGAGPVVALLGTAGRRAPG